MTTETTLEQSGKLGLHQFEGKLLIDDDLECESWYEAQPEWPQATTEAPSEDEDKKLITDDLNSISTSEWLKLCGEALASASRVYDKYHASSNNNKSKTLTSSDKIATHTLLVQEAPLYRLDELHELLSMAQKRGHERNLALDALKDLFLNNLLPNGRLLRSIDDYDFENLSKKQLTKRHLIYMLFESELKEIYNQFVGILEHLSNDNLMFYKKKAVYLVFDLLVSKPENEKILLSILVNKLGDPNKSVSSATMFKLLSIIREHHPLMKSIIVKEVIQLLRRPNLSIRSQYYAVCFLNQMPFQKGNIDVKLARSLVQMYLDLFIICIYNEPKFNQDQAREEQNKLENDLTKKKGKKTRKKMLKKKEKQKLKEQNEKSISEEMKNSKYMTSILTGINRAFPYTNSEQEDEENMKKYEQYFDKLFQIAHAESLTCATQALALIHQICQTNSIQNDRFYQALYTRMIDITQASEKVQASFLHLILKALSADSNMNRIKAFIKRLLQSALISNSSYAGACTVVLFECFKNNGNGKGLVTSFLTLPENDDEDEIFFDADKLENEIGDEEGEEEEVEQDPPSDENVNSEDEANGDKGSVEQKTKKSLLQLNKKSTDLPNGSMQYDPRKRDPKYASAERSSLWEIVSLANHYHPSISMFAKTLCKEMKVTTDIEINGDPLRDYSLITFLDRFCYKRAKNRLKKSLYGKQSNRYRDNPVANSKEFQRLIESGNFEEDDKFLVKFFQSNPQRVAKDPTINEDDELDFDSEEEAYERAIEAEMTRLGGGDAFNGDVLGDSENGGPGISNKGPDIDEQDKDELKAFEKAFENEMVNSDDDDDDDDVNKDDGEIASDDDDEEELESKHTEGVFLLPSYDDPRKGKKSDGKKSKKGNELPMESPNMSVFAAAEDYEEAIDEDIRNSYIDQEKDETMDELEEENQKDIDPETNKKMEKKRKGHRSVDRPSKRTKRSKR